MAIASFRFRHASWVALVIWVVSAGAAHAQDFRQQFSLSTPGARANAMGQAFIGVADDASAMITNPAGLVLLTRPQGYLEFKSGRTLSEEGALFEVESPAALSFFGVSVPLGEYVAVGISRHVYFGDHTTFDDGFGEFELQGVSWAGTIAVNVMPNLQMGVTFARHSLSLSETNIEDENFDIDDSAMGVALGILWTPIPAFSIGTSGVIADEGDDLGEIMPDRFGVGVGIRPSSRLLVSADVTWIQYSIFEADDATEFHAGGEYAFPTSSGNQFFGRAGFFTVPDDEFGEEGGVVGTFGVGAALGRHFQADFAVLTRGEVVLSAGVRF